MTGLASPPARNLATWESAEELFLAQRTQGPEAISAEKAESRFAEFRTRLEEFDARDLGRHLRKWQGAAQRDVSLIYKVLAAKAELGVRKARAETRRQQRGIVMAALPMILEDIGAERLRGHLVAGASTLSPAKLPQSGIDGLVTAILDEAEGT